MTLLTAASMLLPLYASNAEALEYPLVDTMQERCFDIDGSVIECPLQGDALYGQDAQYSHLPFAYIANADETVTDENTGLLWQKTPENDRLQFNEAADYCSRLALGDRSDWRLPTIKELYSLADFRGELLLPDEGEPRPYIDRAYFDFEYPDARMIFAGQYWSSTVYVKGPIINGHNQGAFGFNFADGHIKAYGTGLDFDTGKQAASSGLPAGPSGSDRAPGNYVRCVSGAEGVYGVNDFVAHANGTVTDRASARMWQQADDGTRREWEEALAYCEGLDLGGYQDWKLPNTKELQSIVDYDKLEIPAIDEDIFGITQDSQTLDFWTSTTLGDFKDHANVVVFGKALSKSAQQSEYTDWHGSGAQRSSFKSVALQESSADDDSCSINACDVDRADNLVRCVRYAP